MGLFIHILDLSLVYIFGMEQQAQDQPFDIQEMCLCYAEA